MANLKRSWLVLLTIPAGALLASARPVATDRDQVRERRAAYSADIEERRPDLMRRFLAREMVQLSSDGEAAIGREVVLKSIPDLSSETPISSRTSAFPIRSTSATMADSRSSVVTDVDAFVTVLGCIFLANALAYGWRYALMGWASFAYFSWADWTELGVFMCACGAGVFVKGRRPMIAILTIMILLCLSDPVATLLEK